MIGLSLNRMMQAAIVVCFCLFGLIPRVCAEEPARETVPLETGLYYTIQKGDTLWDLSERFYDSPWVWPDLWEKNKQIPNPHWIYPGQTVRIYSKEEIEAMLAGKKPEPELAVEPGKGPYYLFPGIDRVGYVRQPPVDAWGAIFKAREEKDLLSSGDMIYVRPLGGHTLEAGARFTAYRLLDTFVDQQTKEPIGVQHDIVGVVEVTEAHPGFGVGRIVKSYEAIKIDDLLIPYEPRSPKIFLTESQKGLKGRIIAPQMKISMFAKYFIVFIDQGIRDGVQVGQLYSVYSQEEVKIDPDSEQLTLLPPIDYAEILILRVEETSATALITYSEQPIQAGAKVRAP